MFACSYLYIVGLRLILIGGLFCALNNAWAFEVKASPTCRYVLYLLMKNVFVSLILLSHPAWSAVSEPQFFIGAKGGYQWADDDTYHHSAPNGSIFGGYGGLQLAPSWSWDLGYQYHDDLKADATSINVKTWLIESALRYDWYLQNDLSLYGRLGAAYWDMEKAKPTPGKLDATGISPLGEVGVSYKVTPSLSLSAGYQYIDSIGKSHTGKYDSHAALMSVAYTFSRSTQQIPVESMPVEKTVKSESKPQTFIFSAKDTEGGFGFDSTKLSHGFVQSLTEVAAVLKNYPQARARVVGHTDSIGSKTYNQGLSERRAQAVVEQLVDLGVAKTQLEWRGEGESHPIADNHTPDGRAKNRRVEVTIPSFQYQK